MEFKIKLKRNGVEDKTNPRYYLNREFTVGSSCYKVIDFTINEVKLCYKRHDEEDYNLNNEFHMDAIAMVNAILRGSYKLVENV